MNESHQRKLKSRHCKGLSALFLQWFDEKNILGSHLKSCFEKKSIQ